jgi:broad specificity phosphatase PhoE
MPATPHIYLYLVRHAQSVDNSKGLQSGWSSTPLTPLGQSQATAIASKLAPVSFSAAYSSGSVRAASTLATILSARDDQLSAQVDGRFREWGVGSFDQKPAAAVRAAIAKKLGVLPADLWKFSDGQKFDALAAIDPTHKAENWKTFKARIMAGIQAVVSANPEGTVLIVTHGYVIKHLIKTLTGSWATKDISNTSVTELELRGTKWVMIQQPTTNPKVTP